MRTDGPMLPPSTCALRQTTHPLPFGMCDHEVPFMETRTWRQLSAAPCLLFSLSTTCPQICTSMFAMSRSRGQNLYKAEAVHQGRRCMPLPLVSMGSDELNSGPHAVWQALYPLSHPLSSTAPHILICPGRVAVCLAVLMLVFASQRWSFPFASGIYLINSTQYLSLLNLMALI